MARNQFPFFITAAQLADVVEGVATEEGARIFCRVQEGPAAVVPVAAGELAGFVAEHHVTDIYLVLPGGEPADEADLEFRSTRPGKQVTISIGNSDPERRFMRPSHAITEATGEGLPVLQALDRAIAGLSHHHVRQRGTQRRKKFYWAPGLEGWDLMGYEPIPDDDAERSD